MTSTRTSSPLRKSRSALAESLPCKGGQAAHGTRSLFRRAAGEASYLPTDDASRPAGRRGAVLMIALVCVGLASVVLLALLRLAVAWDDVARIEEKQLQANWLAESALDRAAARLAADADYEGETWRVTPQLLGGREAAVVKIEVQRLPDSPTRRRVRVRADYPEDASQRVRRSKQLEMEIRS